MVKKKWMSWRRMTQRRRRPPEHCVLRLTRMVCSNSGRLLLWTQPMVSQCLLGFSFFLLYIDSAVCSTPLCSLCCSCVCFVAYMLSCLCVIYCYYVLLYTGVKVTWKCWSSTHHRREGINATAFSADGSLVAVAYSRVSSLHRTVSSCVCFIV